VKVWVNAGTRSSTVAAYARAAVNVELIPAGHGDAEASARAFLSWLVVLDDVSEAPDKMRDLWPPRTSTGRTVITTRRTDVLLPGADSISVEVFSPDEAHTYLRARLVSDPSAGPHGMGVIC
jgi:hypothetical protein